MAPKLREQRLASKCFGIEVHTAKQKCVECTLNVHCTKYWKAQCIAKHTFDKSNHICTRCIAKHLCQKGELTNNNHSARKCFGDRICINVLDDLCRQCSKYSQCGTHIREKLKNINFNGKPVCFGEPELYSNVSNSDCDKCKHNKKCWYVASCCSAALKEREVEFSSGFSPYGPDPTGSKRAAMAAGHRKEKSMSDKKSVLDKTLWEGIRDIATKDIWPRLRHGTVLGAADAVSDETLVRAIRMGFGDLYKPWLNNKKWQPIILWAEPTVSAAVLYGGIRLLGWDNKVSELTAEGCLATLEIKAALISAHFTRRLLTAAKELRKNNPIVN